MSAVFTSLPTSFTLGDRASADTPFDFQDGYQLSLDSGADLDSVAAGYFGTNDNAAIAFLSGNDIYFSYFEPSSSEYHKPILQSSSFQGLQQLFAANVGGRSYDDVVVLGGEATSNAPDALYVLSMISDNFDFDYPFDAPIQSSIPLGSDVVIQGGPDVSNAIAAVQDATFVDIDHDGDRDIIVAGTNTWQDYPIGEDEGEYYATGIYSIGLNDGSGRFDFTPMASTGWHTSGSGSGAARNAAATARVTAGDFDGDGYVDVAFGYNPTFDAPLNFNPATAFIVWGDAGSAQGVLNTNNSFTHDWDGPADLQAVTGIDGSRAYLVINFTASAHVVHFTSGRSSYTDVTTDGIPRGVLGTMLDYDLDGVVDLMFPDGGDSTIGFNYVWGGSSGDLDQVGGMHLGSAINQSAGADINGDGKPDFLGINDDHINVYFNTTGNASATAVSTGSLDLVEGQRVEDGAVNGAGLFFTTGNGSDGFAVSVIGGRAAYDNALGYAVVDADGRFGEARFLNLDAAMAGPVDLGTVAESSQLVFFLVADGGGLNPSLDGAFSFIDRDSGEAATLASTTPILRAANGRTMQGDIFHTADAIAFDDFNALNTGGGVQVLSRSDSGGDLLLAFEDQQAADGDADFNDLVLRLTRSEALLGT